MSSVDLLPPPDALGNCATARDVAAICAKDTLSLNGLLVAILTFRLALTVKNAAMKRNASTTIVSTDLGLPSLFCCLSF